jgi:hypothetical protein
MRIDWEQVRTVALTTVVTAVLLFIGYKGYEDHQLLLQVVGYLNAQAQAAQPQVKAPQPNVITNPTPEPKK